MSRGRRFNGKNNRLNVKKVIAVIITILVILMFVTVVRKTLTSNPKENEKSISLAYYTIYENNKWGVINSKGEIVIEPKYDEMIVIPNPEKNVFLVTYDVNYNDGTYKSKAINDKDETIFTGFDKVETIQNQDKQNTVWYTTSCLKVEKDNKYGLIDFSGKILLDCQFDEIKPILHIKNSLITVKDNKKGLISTTGATIINNEYEDIEALTDKYENGYIVKNSENKFGIIGTNKKNLVPVKYDKIENINSGENYIVKIDNGYKLYNSSKEEETPIDADEVKSIDDKNIIIKKSNKYGIINTSGETIVEPKYEDLKYAFSDYYIAKNNNKYGIVNSKGETKIDFTYENLSYRKDADFIEGEKQGTIQTDIIDRTLTTQFSGIISEVNVNKGYIKVRINDEYKYYNFKFEEKKNKEILLGNTLFLSKKDGKYGYVNKDGIVVVNYIYDDAMEQNNSGYAAVKKDGKWGAIDQKGNTIVEPSLNLDNNTVIDFIGAWHLAEDANAGYYTK